MVKQSTFAIALGLLVSLVLFWLMQTMISNNQQPLKDNKVLQMTEFIKLKKLNKDVESKRELPEEEPPPPPPEESQQKPIEQKVIPEMEIPELSIPEPDLLTNSDIQLAVVKKKSKPKVKLKKKPAIVVNKPTITVAPTVVSKVTTTKPVKVVVKKPVKVAPPKMSNKVSSNVRPTYRVAPKYPRRALSRRQKGWVKVQFIITANGRVKSPFVVSSKPSGVFDKAAIKAIRRWKFKAKKVNGQAVAQRAVQTIQFKLR